MTVTSGVAAAFRVLDSLFSTTHHATLQAAYDSSLDDGNPDTAADPNWTPLFNPALPVATAGIGPALITPPYPDHVSGATTYASMHAFASFFGTDEMGVPFYLTSSRFPIDPALPREQRFFTRFADVTNEILEAPIWAGIHFRDADVQAAQFGSEVEHHIHQHLFASQ